MQHYQNDTTPLKCWIMFLDVDSDMCETVIWMERDNLSDV